MVPFRSLLYCLASFAAVVQGSVTVYYQIGQEPLATTTAAGAVFTGLPAYDTRILNPPDLPNPMPAPAFTIQLQNGGTPGASILQGTFFGFSIEMSVANQVLGKNSSLIEVPFLNLISNLVQRSGHVRIRVGGNTQETAVLVDSLPNGRMIAKDNDNTSNPTKTPPVDFTTDLLYMMRNISELVNVRWFLGIPFFDTTNWRLEIVEKGQQILGDHLLGFQAGNEPDYYIRHGHRPATYNPYDYFGEIGDLINVIASNPNIPNKDCLIGPGIAAGEWTPESVWNTGFVDSYSQQLAYLAVEHYPLDNCFSRYGTGTYRDPQANFINYLTHDAGKGIVATFLNTTAYAQTKGKEVIMFETNSASCGGLPGISNSFGGALWGLDYALQMAHSNFSGALFHIGGQSVYYNPFTPPPTNETGYHKWSVGAIYYSALIMAEALGSSNGSQVMDLQANFGNTWTPAYAIYENGDPVRVALFNFMTDAPGSTAADYVATISIAGIGGGSATPSSVKVKYFRAESVGYRGRNMTWAGQTFGDFFESDGRLMGTEDVKTVQCDTVVMTCAISVPAPAFALVFLTDSAFTATGDHSAGYGNGKGELGASIETFPTTVHTKMLNTATVERAILATSNGMINDFGSTSRGSSSGVVGWKEILPSVALLTSLVVGAMVILGRF
ncbi:glycoside hydrolase family 79 protein [Mycena floridula]|nr:glycoside hydrolase family 79 protein [Mycena floridula]